MLNYQANWANLCAMLVRKTTKININGHYNRLVQMALVTHQVLLPEMQFLWKTNNRKCYQNQSKIFTETQTGLIPFANSVRLRISC